MADPLRHRQTKGAATDMVDLTPPRHIPTLPGEAIRGPARPSIALDTRTIFVMRCPVTKEIYHIGYDPGPSAARG